MNQGPYRTPAPPESNRLDAWERCREGLFALLRMACVALWVFGVPVGLSVTEEACTPGQTQGAKTALEVTKVTCILTNALLPDSEVAKICDIADPFIQPMKDILGVQREKLAAAKNLGCEQPDAGKK